MINGGQVFILGGATIQNIEAVIELKLTDFGDIVTLGAQAETATVYAGGGDDTLIGNDTANNLYGGGGSDSISAGDGNDYLSGGDTPDDGGDVLYGEAGDDQLDGHVGNDTLDGGDGIDLLHGGEGVDTLIGGSGDDFLDGGWGNDSLQGGAGSDIYVVDAASDSVIELAGEGIDEVRTGISHTLGANVENLILTGPAATTGIGNGLDNLIQATVWSVDVALSGLAGNDRLVGYNGNDTLDGGDGSDELFGGGGDDTLIGRGGFGNADVAVFAGNYADYQIVTGDVTTVTGIGGRAGDGTDSLYGIEELRFADITVSLGINPNNPPIFGEPGMADQEVDDGSTFTYTIPATAFMDLDGTPLTFAATLADGSPLPAWLTFNASTRTFSGVPPLAAIGISYDILVTAADQYSDPEEDFGDYQLSDTFLLTINQAPGPDISGTNGDDVLQGTFRDETMIGLLGNDRFYGSAGADRLDGGAGLGDTVYYSASPEG
jgi:Ca2+-binding RTX toxin-like protein